MKKINSNLILLFLMFISGGVVYYFVAVHDSKPAGNVVGQKGAENVAQASKDSVSTQNTNKDGSASSGNAVRPAATGELQGSTLTITGFSQSGSVVRASATVNSSNVGTCYFGFSSADTKPVSRVNQSQGQSGNQLCSIEIPEVEFSKLGVWQMLISFTQNSAKVEASQDVKIN